MKRLVLLSIWWFLWYTVDGMTWQQHGLRFPTQARCESYRAIVSKGTGKDVMQQTVCRAEASQ
jgi:hypothetical protein